MVASRVPGGVCQTTDAVGLTSKQELRILFVHTNYPAQFRRLAPALAAEGHDVVFLARNREWHAPPPGGIRVKVFEPHRPGGSAHLHPYLRRLDQAVLIGQAVYRACRELADEGWRPDWIVNHVGFGCGFYLSDAFPNAKRAGLFEWYYNAFGSDVDFLRRGHVENLLRRIGHSAARRQPRRRLRLTPDPQTK